MAEAAGAGLGGGGRLQLGVMLPVIEGALDGRTARWADLRTIAQTAEAIGFDTLMVPDHLLFRDAPAFGNMPAIIVPNGESRGIWDVWTLLTALAEATTRVTLGPFVACTTFRNPALLAKMADTLDEVSDSRLILGLGAGWHEPEHTAFGYPYGTPGERVDRFEEALQIIVPLLREGRVDFQGKHYAARDCELRPRGPSPHGPPIWIGAGKPRMLRLVARYADAYNTDYVLSAARAAELTEGALRACRQVGRDPATLPATSALRVAIDETGTLPRNEAGVGTFLLGGMPRQGVVGTPEELAARIRSFADAGLQHMTIYILHPQGLPGIERFARVIEELRKE